MSEWSILLKILIGWLAGWRLTILLVYEDGPFEILDKIRDFVGVRYDEHSRKIAKNTLAQLFICPRCMSVWVGWLMSFLLFYGILEVILLGLVISTLIIVLQETVKVYE